MEEDVNTAIADERDALLDLVKHPSAAYSTLFTARARLDIVVKDLAPVDLGTGPDPTAELEAAVRLDQQASFDADARKDKKALPLIREALAKKKAALRMLEQVTVTPPSGSSLEACAIQSSPTQDEVKVGGPAGTTGSVIFAVGSATPQARTFSLNATAPFAFVGPFVAPTAGFATITVQVNATERIALTIPANSSPASDCTLHP